MWKVEISIAKDDTVLGVMIDAPDWVDADVVEDIADDIINSVRFRVTEYHNASAAILFMKEVENVQEV